MIFSRDYSRAILTLRQEEGGFSAENGVFGRAVVEIRNGRARVMVYAQGLKSGSMCRLCASESRSGEYKKRQSRGKVGI